jgi:cyanate permease
MSAARSPAAEYARFLAWAVAIAIALVLLGYAPTRRLGGEGALPAMIAGCLIGVIASAVGALPVLLSRRAGSGGSPLQGLYSMALRSVAMVVLGLSVGLSGWFPIRPLLLWIALGYVAQLALDVRYAVRGV